MMSVQTKRVLWRFVIFGLIGLLMEVFFGALGGLFKSNWNLRGHTSIWMMLDYGLLGVVLMPIARPLIRQNVALPLRAGVYMIGIFAVEFVSGWIFDKCHIEIWDYSHLPYNVHGYITLMYAPFWYGLGLVVESLHRKVDAAALLLTLRVSAEQVDKLNGHSNAAHEQP